MKKESVILRLVLISGLILGLLIPLVMIESLITERQSFRSEAVSEVNRNWSGRQVIGGPLLTVESEQTKKNNKGDVLLTHKSRHILPDELNLNCKIYPEVRHKGIYQVVLYKAAATASGYFNIEENDIKNSNKGFMVSLNISDLRGIEDGIIFKWNGKEKIVIPGIKNHETFNSGITVQIDSVLPGINKYEFEIKLKGSEDISFIPVGKSSKVSVLSLWNNPVFYGAYLPSERSINDKGFNAKWNVNYFNRSYPQAWEEGNYDLNKSAFGVILVMPVDEYQKSMRSAKYGILIILLTFVSFFMIELFSRKVIHPVQYFLVGLSLVIFYALLVSLSEYILFMYAYLIASALVIILIAFYVRSIYNSIKIAFIITALLTGFYGFLYVLLQLQDMALLLGTAALFIVLALIMYLTRKINWFEIFEAKNREQ
jgi:inner membrane protein